MYAAEYSSAGVVKLFLEKGAGVNDVDSSGRTALFFASEYGASEIVQILLGANARVDACTSMPLALEEVGSQVSLPHMVEEADIRLTPLVGSSRHTAIFK
jgi:ankyrin repeat protein